MNDIVKDVVKAANQMSNIFKFVIENSIDIDITNEDFHIVWHAIQHKFTVTQQTLGRLERLPFYKFTDLAKFLFS